MSKKSIIELDKERKDKLIQSLQLYCSKEFNLELESFPAQFFLDFIINEFGATFYNQALDDVNTWLSDKIQYLADDIYLLSKQE
ncbi:MULTISPECIES: DUF2164 domain-containing protein [unclassified Acinetobacter]|uniref:DUF2164 domain-containing protein n=1 Tax=unclassified Acinetobacter TaxID=196816 RepID=UPI0029350DEE|nr:MULTISPECIES: DUF2164 domain-containing protein [unclassified Acinetobacter]WOE31814.1 DUF2164 domain-containing protein [Acinetobacter sp. SAAs470]WOE37281.1 DUF2164 domain-containing protein [Acinetobacter sp. SAAs474]